MLKQVQYREKEKERERKGEREREREREKESEREREREREGERGREREEKEQEILSIMRMVHVCIGHCKWQRAVIPSMTMAHTNAFANERRDDHCTSLDIISLCLCCLNPAKLRISHKPSSTQTY